MWPEMEIQQKINVIHIDHLTYVTYEYKDKLQRIKD